MHDSLLGTDIVERRIQMGTRKKTGGAHMQRRVVGKIKDIGGTQGMPASAPAGCMSILMPGGSGN